MLEAAYAPLAHRLITSNGDDFPMNTPVVEQATSSQEHETMAPLDFTHLRAHARELEADLEAIKADLARMKARYQSDAAAIDLAAN